jgi:hypothetical protein
LCTETICSYLSVLYSLYTVSVTELFSAYLKIREYAYKHGKHAPFIHVEIFFTSCVHFLYVYTCWYGYVETGGFFTHTILRVWAEGEGAYFSVLTWSSYGDPRKCSCVYE